jgi:hypothetical protein
MLHSHLTTVHAAIDLIHHPAADMIQMTRFLWQHTMTSDDCSSTG